MCSANPSSETHDICQKINNINNTMLQYARNSFDRFGDDLCQEVLQYLRLSDALRFECVSKQWKHLILAKQQRLNISDSVNYGEMASAVDWRAMTCQTSDIILQRGGTQTDIEMAPGDVHRSCHFTWIVNKCVNLTHIKICVRYFYCHVNTLEAHQILRIIADNCNNLRNIRFLTNRPRQLSDADLIYFGKKRGNALHSIQFSTWSKHSAHKVLFKYCPNLKCVIDLHLVDLKIAGRNKVGNSGLNKCELLLPKLVEVRELNVNDNTDLLERFVDDYGDKLCKLKIIHWHKPTTCADVMCQLAKLKKLDTFIVSENFWHNRDDCKQFVDGFSQLARASDNQLKFLALDFRRTTISGVLYTQLLVLISVFMRLKHLDITFDRVTDLSSDVSAVNLLKGCTQLTHLCIYGKGIDGCKFDSNNLNKYLPKLSECTVNGCCMIVRRRKEGVVKK